MKKIIKGTGITKREFIRITSESSKEEWEEFMKHRHKGIPNDPLWTIRHILPMAENALKKLGLPYGAKSYPRSNGGSALLPLIIQDAGHKEYDSIAWYAAEIIQAFYLLEKAIDENDVTGIVTNSAKISELNMQASMKSTWEKHALNGEKSSLGAAKGGKLHHAVDRQAFTNDYRAEREGNPRSPRTTIIDSLYSDYKEVVQRSTLNDWAKAADLEDNFTRKAGRPKKNG